jgi:hypothetical protein
MTENAVAKEIVDVAYRMHTDLVFFAFLAVLCVFA